MTAELLDSAMATLDETPGSADVFRELTRRNTRGPSMHRVDRVALKVRDRNLSLVSYVPIARPSGVVVLLDRSRSEGGNEWATESLARRIAERTSCEVVTPQFGEDGTDDVDDTGVKYVDAAVALVRWSVTNRRQTDPGRTTPLVVVGHGAGGLTAARLMSRAHFSEVGAHVAAWILVSPSFARPDVTHEPLDLSEDDLRYWRVIGPATPQGTSAADVAEVAAGVDPETAPVEVHTGNYLDHTASAASRFVDLLAEAEKQARAHVYAGQMNGFFSIMSIPAGERTLQALIRTVRACVLAAEEGAAAHE